LTLLSTDIEILQTSFDLLTRAGFKGGQTGQLPRASTTRGASTKTEKKIITQGNIKILFETDNLELKQEAQLSPSDRAMRLVSSNLANCHTTVQKLLIRQGLTKLMV